MANCLAIGVVEMDGQTFIEYAWWVEFAVSMYMYFRAFLKPISSLTFEYVSLLVGLGIFNLLFLLRLIGESNIIQFDTLTNLILFLFTSVVLLLVLWWDKKLRAVSAKERVLVLVSTGNLPERLTRLMKDLRGSVCYIALTNACPHAKELFKRVAKDVKKVRFLSISDKDGMPAEEIDEQKVVMSKLLQIVVEEKYDYIVVDDICSFGLKPPELESLVSSIANMAHVKKTGLVLMCNRDHLSPEIILDLEMFMDKTIK